MGHLGGDKAARPPSLHHPSSTTRPEDRRALHSAWSVSDPRRSGGSNLLPLSRSSLHKRAVWLTLNLLFIFSFSPPTAAAVTLSFLQVYRPQSSCQPTSMSLGLLARAHLRFPFFRLRSSQMERRDVRGAGRDGTFCQVQRSYQ